MNPARSSALCRTTTVSFSAFIWIIGALALAGCFNRPPAHGTALLLEADTGTLQGESERQQIMASVRQTLSRRVERFGANFSLESSGTNGLLLKVGISAEPAVNDLKKLLVRGGVLEFRLVHPQSQALIIDKQTPPGYVTLSHKTSAGGRELVESLLVKTQPEMKGGVKNAMVTRASTGVPEVMFTLSPEGAKRFAEITRENIGRQLAIILDGELRTAPVIRSPIEGGSGVISGVFTPQEALELANVMETPLTVPVKIVETRTF
jgi:SecD/SecF fusion protein